MSTLLEVADLAVAFDRPRGEQPFVAVDGLSYTVADGETVAVIGESGSGKSVAAQAVLGILETPPARVVRGTVRHRGTDLLTLGPAARRGFVGSSLAMVFQDALAALNPVQRVGPQITEGWRVREGASRAAAQARAVELLDRVRIPDAAGVARAFPHELSGGMRQRAMIAMAIAEDPELLIADEPTTALDVTVQRAIMDLLRELQDESGMGLVLITHDLGVAADVADRLVVMKAGRVVEAGETERVLRRPEQGYTRRLLAAVPRLDERARPAEGAAHEDAPLLEVRGLRKRFAGRRRGWGRRAPDTDAVDGVDLELRRGEVLGLVGESGCGKSTLASMLLLLAEPTAGSIRWWGEDAAGLDRAATRRLRRRLQVVLQDPYSSLDPRMSVRAAIGEAFAIHPDLCPRDDRAARIAELLAQVGLDPEHADRYPHELSGGQRQRVVIARALAVEPEVLVCDEPVSALDVSVQAQVLDLLEDLRRDLGLAYLLISHDLAVVRQLADRVAVMQHGTIVETGDADALYASPEHPYTRELLAAAPSAL